jgi:hypothetical protein
MSSSEMGYAPRDSRFADDALVVTCRNPTVPYIVNTRQDLSHAVAERNLSVMKKDDRKATPSQSSGSSAMTRQSLRETIDTGTVPIHEHIWRNNGTLLPAKQHRRRRRLFGCRQVNSTKDQRLLFSADILPLYAQVEIGDAESKEYPQWATGRELTTANSETVAVATRRDIDGKVKVEVWLGPPAFGHSDIREAIFAGEIVVRSGKLRVGSSIANDVHVITVPVGHHKLRIFRTPSRSAPAEQIFFVLD